MSVNHRKIHKKLAIGSIGSSTLQLDLEVFGSNGLRLPGGPPAGRIDIESNFRYNSDTGLIEWFDGTNWRFPGDNAILNQFSVEQSANFWISGTGRMQNLLFNYDDYSTIPSSSSTSQGLYSGLANNVQGNIRSGFIQTSGAGRPPMLINPNGNPTIIGPQVASNGYSYQRIVIDENTFSPTDSKRGVADFWNMTIVSKRFDGDIGVDMFESLLKLGMITSEAAATNDGCIYYDSTNDLYRGRKNGVWRTFLMDDFSGGGGGGEANTASNIGGGIGLFTTKSGVDLPFKSLVQGTGMSLVSGASTVTITNSAPDQTVVLSNGSGISVTGTYPNFTIASTITQYTDEMAQDTIATMIQNGTGITWSYNDGSNTLTPTVTITQYTDELAQDAVGNILTDTSTIDFTYNDAGPSISASVIADSSVQKLAVRKNSTGGDVGTRRRINFIEGSNVTITIADDAGDNELDVTIASSGGSSGYATIQEEGSSLTQRPTMNFIGGGITAADDAGNTRTNITLDADLSAIAALTGTGLARRTGVDTWTLDTSTYVTENIYNANGTLTANRTVSGGTTRSLTINDLTTFSVVSSGLLSLTSGTANVDVTASGNVRLIGTNISLQPAVGSGTTTIGGGVSYGSPLSPAQITSNQNDYSPTSFLGSYFIRLSSDAARDITGLGLYSVSSNKAFVLANVGSFDITLKNENAGSTAQHRFSLPGDFVIEPNECITVIYDDTTQRWRVIDKVYSSTGGGLADGTYGDITVSGGGTVVEVIGVRNNDYQGTSVSANGTVWRYNSSNSRFEPYIAAETLFQTLTDGATITWNRADGLRATVTLGGNRTLAMTGMQAGDVGTLIVKQDGGGNRTLTLPAGSEVVGAGNGAITLTATASAIDIISFMYDGTNYWWNYGKNYT